jgi:hypothetical protein
MSVVNWLRVLFCEFAGWWFVEFWIDCCREGFACGGGMGDGRALL